MLIQYSCLENHMDRGAWWAAIYGVVQSQKRLKRLSSSSSSILSMECLWNFLSKSTSYLSPRYTHIHSHTHTLTYLLMRAAAAAAAAKSLQSFPTLCDPIDSSPPGSPVPGMLQARTLEWVAISFSGSFL